MNPTRRKLSVPNCLLLGEPQTVTFRDLRDKNINAREAGTRPSQDCNKPSQLTWHQRRIGKMLTPSSLYADANTIEPSPARMTDFHHSLKQSAATVGHRGGPAMSRRHCRAVPPDQNCCRHLLEEARQPRRLWIHIADNYRLQQHVIRVEVFRGRAIKVIMGGKLVICSGRLR